MELKRAANVIQSEDAVNQATQVVKDLAMRIYGGGGEMKRSIRNALFGTWLGHPFHPLIVTVPAGSWALTEVLDLLEAVTGDHGYGRAADVTVITGMAGALLAVASGLNDWRFTSGKTSRLGLVHGVSNLTGVAAMGLEKIHFFWYVKRISALALVGYFGGIATYLTQYWLMHG